MVCRNRKVLKCHFPENKQEFLLLPKKHLFPINLKMSEIIALEFFTRQNSPKF